MIVKINPQIIKYNKEIQTYCKLPYPGHVRGCPNYRKKHGCPPGQPLINEVLDFNKDVYLIYTEFDILAHSMEMKRRHPKWTLKQTYNCLYWQSRARKIQQQENMKALKKYKLNVVIFSPEAYGVNIHELMQRVDIILEWPPRGITRLVSLGGWGK